ncbi:MAG TPA: hypothetical protein VFB63_10745, partial [Bryobacteraceae bacterium]|nr:hypothetical protein [Bryobacteraceae bacterium]
MSARLIHLRPHVERSTSARAATMPGRTVVGYPMLPFFIRVHPRSSAANSHSPLLFTPISHPLTHIPAPYSLSPSAP